jgi:phosphonate degradation associated HDIG domain protein
MVIDDIFDLFQKKGNAAYFGEAVTESEHALQCAHLAEQSGAMHEVIAAALLHDIGHLLHGRSEDIAERGIDGRHEDIGARWLARHFGPAVVDPVRLHVVAKRYLCTIDPTYRSSLSPASQLSLQLQGGPMTADEVRRFEREQHFRAAVNVRRWDDGAKVAGLAVPGLEHYRSCLESAIAHREDACPTRTTPA